RRRLTGQEALDRLFWDARINRDAFTLGYTDRTHEAGVRELPLLRWDPRGNIPAHRITYLRCGTEVVWSRDGDVDRLADEDLPEPPGAADRAALTGGVVSPRMRPRQVSRHLGGRWEAVAGGADVAGAASFRLATWNVLCDFADAEVPTLEVRLPLLTAELARAA